LREPDDLSKGIISKFEKQIRDKINDELGAPPLRVRAKDILLIGYKTQKVSGTDFFLKASSDNASVDVYVYRIPTLC
jgi:hypothetical protein